MRFHLLCMREGSRHVFSGGTARAPPHSLLRRRFAPFFPVLLTALLHLLFRFFYSSVRRAQQPLPPPQAHAHTSPPIFSHDPRQSVLALLSTGTMWRALVWGQRHWSWTVPLSASKRGFGVGLISTSPRLCRSRIEAKWSKVAAQQQRTSRRPSATQSSTTTYDISGSVMRGASASSSPQSAAPVVLPPLRCPGGPRVKAEGIKQLYKVPHAGFLSKYDQRFMLNLKLTHQLVSYLSRTTLTTPDKVLVELGPGVGSLTRSLLTRPCVGVLGIEVDERFNPHLEQIRNYTNNKFQWVTADVLKVDELELLKATFPRFVKANIRRPPTPGYGTQAANSEAGTASSSEPQRATFTDEAGENDAEGYEGAPLRSAQRERLLRQRRARHPYQHSDDTHRRGVGGAAAPEAAASPNPAFDVTNHWWANGHAKVEVIANLPFEIITELLMRYAADCSQHRGLFAFGRVPMHVFTQREVAERILAPAGSVEFSRLSVLCQCFFHVRLKQTFVEKTYYPHTEVEGAMLTLEPRSVPLAQGLDASTLIHFTNLLMKPGLRAATVHKALSRFAPAELVQYMLQELRMDGAMTVLDLSVVEVTRLACLWQQFVTMSQQQSQQGGDGAGADARSHKTESSNGAV
ncbi:rRNA dimethyltransferase, putative [Leishmania tarentolae]|uniref:rRNA adenine N(6)-methyltransferase n=1 Tax=Leishmania tarentolae TaxID=5689 RepID=A0A640KTY2_LEITA|nr:rRNA dimethyltransferase, putative [Leishmania tarentolae]